MDTDTADGVFTDTSMAKARSSNQTRASSEISTDNLLYCYDLVFDDSLFARLSRRYTYETLGLKGIVFHIAIYNQYCTEIPCNIIMIQFEVLIRHPYCAHTQRFSHLSRHSLVYYPSHANALSNTVGFTLPQANARVQH